MRTSRPAARLRLSTGSGTIGSRRLIVRFMDISPSNRLPEQRATNAWRHKVVVPRGGEDDFRGVREEPGALQVDALIEREDQRGPEREQPGRPVEHDKGKRKVEERNPQQQEIDRQQKRNGVGAEYDDEVG